MITIFSATNRRDSNTEIVAEVYRKLAEDQGVKTKIYRFVDLPDEFILTENYGEPPESFSQVLKEFIHPVGKFVFVIPEYNGSFPGITKLFLDIIHPSTWEGKKAALVGIASGRAGNLRGMDHLAAVLNYLKMEVFSRKIPVSSIEKSIGDQGQLTNNEYLDLLKGQIRDFLNF